LYILPSNNVVIEVTTPDDYMMLFENGSTTALQSSAFVNIPGGFHERVVVHKQQHS
jgi:threonine dehydrogenase-like Zn-dependent dehydrogenase